MKSKINFLDVRDFFNDLAQEKNMRQNGKYEKEYDGMNVACIPEWVLELNRYPNINIAVEIEDGVRLVARLGVALYITSVLHDIICKHTIKWKIKKFLEYEN